MAKSSSPSRSVSRYDGPMPKRSVSTRPEDPALGDFHKEDGNLAVYIGRGMWTWFPTQAANLINSARAFGWGVKLVKVPTMHVVGTDGNGKELSAPLVRLILLLGREQGPSKNGANSKGYTYRLMWDTREAGKFRLVSKYRRTTTDPEWTEIGSVYEIRSIMSRFPVIKPEGSSDAETDSEAEIVDQTSSTVDRQKVPVGEDGA